MLTPVMIPRPAFDFITAGGMLAMVALMSGAWIVLLRRRSNRLAWWAALIVSVIVLLNVLGDYLGLFSRSDLLPPPFAIFALFCVGVSFAIGMGTVGNSLARSIRIEALVALQIFRFPLELLMLRAAYLGIMPFELSALGYNLDVLTGLGALMISAYCAWTRHLPIRVIWLWNLVGIVCLMAIGALAVLTSPNLHAFGSEAGRVNTWVLFFPYSLLPTVLVSYAIFGHILLTRKLLAQHPILPLLRQSGLFARPQACDPW